MGLSYDKHSRDVVGHAVTEEGEQLEFGAVCARVGGQQVEECRHATARTQRAQVPPQ